MRSMLDIQVGEAEYLGIMNGDRLELKIYRSALCGSNTENGLLIRQAEFLIDSLPPLPQSIRQGYVIMLKGLEINFFRIGLFNERSKKIISHTYSVDCIDDTTFIANNIDSQFFFNVSELKGLIEYESSLVHYIRRKGHYNDYHYV
ncbi:hypothetical protein [Fulvivirga lutimaris]|uniref:hypothetical protein n=1 Tax=Fulvivirga lutimaris TaxID=1819566 RepID=UPI0012BC125D|nr:hypothetical protein [Fulvivirga lutimaris]MTI40837.1 hypothetical protein [Fulvivirga lutimaris]